MLARQQFRPKSKGDVGRAQSAKQMLHLPLARTWTCQQYKRRLCLVCRMQTSSLLPLLPPLPLLLQAFKLYHAIDSELKDYEWRWNCTDHNVSRAVVHCVSTHMPCAVANWLAVKILQVAHGQLSSEREPASGSGASPTISAILARHPPSLMQSSMQGCLLLSYARGAHSP